MLSPKFDTCFFERYAMASLATLLGDHYAHLVNRDRPDLQDEVLGIGIEVTRAIPENKHIANALVNEMAGLGDGSLMGSNEYEYWSMALPLKRILEIKMNKVNDGFYGDFSEFGLFVFTKDDLDLPQVEQAVLFMKEQQATQSIRYDRLFISQIQTLYSCDLVLGQILQFKVSRTQRKQFYESAVGR